MIEALGQRQLQMPAGLTVLTFTAMIYAMVKKVVKPAWISRENLAPLISFSCKEDSQQGFFLRGQETRTWPLPWSRKTLPKVVLAICRFKFSIMTLTPILNNRNQVSRLLAVEKKRRISWGQREDHASSSTLYN